MTSHGAPDEAGSHPSSLPIAIWLAVFVATAAAEAVADSGAPVAGATGALVAAVLLRRDPRRAAPPSAAALHRHLSWCRRRGASADVLVVPTAGAAQADALRGALRCSDSAAVLRIGGGSAVVAVLDRERLSRVGLESRLAAVCAVPQMPCGWARFPDDGLTLELLVLHARGTVPSAQRPPAHVRSQRRRVLARRSP